MSFESKLHHVENTWSHLFQGKATSDEKKEAFIEGVVGIATLVGGGLGLRAASRFLPEFELCGEGGLASKLPAWMRSSAIKGEQLTFKEKVSLSALEEATAPFDQRIAASGAQLERFEFPTHLKPLKGEIMTGDFLRLFKQVPEKLACLSEKGMLQQIKQMDFIASDSPGAELKYLKGLTILERINLNVSSFTEHHMLELKQLRQALPNLQTMERWLP